jgi:hypothetical protein
LLVTGVAGVAGYNAFHYFRRQYDGQVIGIRRKDNWPLRGPGILACDGDDRDALARLFDKHQFAAVLNCEGTCKLKSCELDPRMAERVNIDSVTTMLDVIAGTRTRVVHLSIDLVFSGTRGGGHVEEDETDPVTVYGKTMAEAERILLQNASAAHLAADGCQLQRPRGGHRLDSTSLQEGQAGDALLRRNPHADLHGLPQSAPGKRAHPIGHHRPVSRRRAAEAEPFPDRPNRQPHRRLRP